MKQLAVLLLPLDGILVHCRLLWYEATSSSSTPLGWDTSPLQVTSRHFFRLFPKQFSGSIYMPGSREVLWELSVLPQNATWVHQPELELVTFRAH